MTRYCSDGSRCDDLTPGHVCGARCSCGKTFYACHNPKCSAHPLPADGSPCECCGQVALLAGGTDTPKGKQAGGDVVPWEAFDETHPDYTDTPKGEGE